MKKRQFDELLESVHEGGAILRAMTPTPGHICGTPNAMCDCSCYQHEEDDMTPETLRKWAEAERGVASDMRRTELVDDLDAAADAWEAQVDRIANGIAVLGEENIALRTRLEAAEAKVPKQAPITPCPKCGRRDWVLHACDPEELAALAGEETG